jgi:general secretion pathway protein G
VVSDVGERGPRAAARLRRAAPGFTLIEMLVVVAIIGILAGVAVGQYQRSIQKAKEAVLKENLITTRTSINLFFADKGKYPPDLQTLVDEKYLHKVPIDPITQSANTWEVVYSEQDDMDISTEPGVMDLRSGAEGTALDGSAYSEW